MKICVFRISETSHPLFSLHGPSTPSTALQFKRARHSTILLSQSTTRRKHNFVRRPFSPLASLCSLDRLYKRAKEELQAQFIKDIMSATAVCQTQQYVRHRMLGITRLPEAKYDADKTQLSVLPSIPFLCYLHFLSTKAVQEFQTKCRDALEPKYDEDRAQLCVLLCRISFIPCTIFATERLKRVRRM